MKKENDMKKYGISLLQPVLARETRALAHATTGGGTLPWNQPLLVVSDALWGTPAHAIMTAVIVFAGLAWA
jgi:type IV secretory pathway VirB2 component (pilin)